VEAVNEDYKRYPCFCRPAPRFLAKGEVCPECEADRVAWNKKATFNNEVRNSLRDICKAMARIVRYFFIGRWEKM
jgi:hypothetical protein